MIVIVDEYLDNPITVDAEKITIKIKGTTYRIYKGTRGRGIEISLVRDLSNDQMLIIPKDGNCVEIE